MMPRRATSAARRRAINTKITDEIRAALEAAASASGRTLSHEIEHRLEQSFDRTAIVRDLAKVMREEQITAGIDIRARLAKEQHGALLAKRDAFIVQRGLHTVPPSTASLAADQIAAMLDHWDD